MDHEQNFPSTLDELDPYLNQGWKEHELMQSAVYVRTFAGASFYTIPLETLDSVPVFIQTRKAADGKYHGWLFKALMVDLSEEEMKRFATKPNSDE